MARIDLRNCDVRVKDGLSGTAAVNQPAPGAPKADDTSLTIKTVALNTAVTDKVPVGVRFTLAGETTPVVHVVTGRTPTDAATTTAITFSPPLGAGAYADAAVVTFQAQLIEIKIGDGDFKYTESNQYKYDRDRGLLDTVRTGDEEPMDVSTNFTFEHVKSGTGEAITPIEAIKGIGAASEWVSASADPCEPYAVDLEVANVPSCTTGFETFTVPGFP